MQPSQRIFRVRFIGTFQFMLRAAEAYYSGPYLRGGSISDPRKFFLDECTFYLIYSFSCIVPVPYLFQIETLSLLPPLVG